MKVATMKTTIETPMKVGSLPTEIRGNLPVDTIVRVSLEILRDENGFTPEKAEELRRAIKEAEDERDTLPTFDNAKDLIAHLHAECEKDD